MASVRKSRGGTSRSRVVRIRSSSKSPGHAAPYCARNSSTRAGSSNASEARAEARLDHDPAVAGHEEAHVRYDVLCHVRPELVERRRELVPDGRGIDRDPPTPEEKPRLCRRLEPCERPAATPSRPDSWSVRKTFQVSAPSLDSFPNRDASGLPHRPATASAISSRPAMTLSSGRSSTYVGAARKLTGGSPTGTLPFLKLSSRQGSRLS